MVFLLFCWLSAARQVNKPNDLSLWNVLVHKSLQNDSLLAQVYTQWYTQLFIFVYTLELSIQLYYTTVFTDDFTVLHTQL